MFSLPIYMQYSRLHLGNRHDTLTAEEIQRLGEFEESRAKWVIMLILSNSLFNYVILSISTMSYYEFYFFAVIGINLCIFFISIFWGSFIFSMKLVEEE